MQIACAPLLIPRQNLSIVSRNGHDDFGSVRSKAVVSSSRRVGGSGDRCRARSGSRGSDRLDHVHCSYGSILPYTAAPADVGE
jgi:hypothetical protein